MNEPFTTSLFASPSLLFDFPEEDWHPSPPSNPSCILYPNSLVFLSPSPLSLLLDLDLRECNFPGLLHLFILGVGRQNMIGTPTPTIPELFAPLPSLVAYLPELSYFLTLGSWLALELASFLLLRH